MLYSKLNLIKGYEMKKIVLITGASGDIGAAIARKFAEQNYNIIYHYFKNLNQGAINALSAKTNILPVQADLTQKADIERLVETSVKTFGKLDVIVNCAGISSEKLSIDESYESINSVISTNLISAIYLTSLTIPNLNENASIINISSIWGEFGGSGETTYAASKAGLIGYTKALSQELGASGIRVNAVAPGLIKSKMNSKFSKKEQEVFVEDHTSLQRIGTPEDVANAVMFLASDCASYITGETIRVNGGYL